MKNFTFKTEKATGAYASFFDDTIYIKLNKKICGSIFKKGDVYKIQLRILKSEKYDDSNANCKWMNITLINEFDSVNDAKKWINEKKEKIHSSFTIFIFEEDQIN